MLSFIGSIFDPLGILASALIEPKCIIQDLWKQSIDWDHPIPLDILDKWKTWEDTLDSLTTIEIPRWYRYTSSSDTAELHAFSDSLSITYVALRIFEL